MVAVAVAAPRPQRYSPSDASTAAAGFAAKLLGGGCGRALASGDEESDDEGAFAAGDSSGAEGPLPLRVLTPRPSASFTFPMIVAAVSAMIVVP